jgi:hypothetical protein
MEPEGTYNRIYNSPPPAPILSEINPVYAPHQTSLRSILILSSHLRVGLPSSLLPSRFPRSISLIPRPLCIPNIIFFGEELLAPRPNPPSWRTTPCRLSATAYSKYSQLSSISGGRSSIRNLRTRHAVVIGTHLSLWQGPTYLGLSLHPTENYLESKSAVKPRQSASLT